MCPALAYIPYPSELAAAWLVTLFDTPLFLLIVALALVPAVRARRWQAIAAFVLAIGSAYVVTYGLKQLFMVPRLSDAWLVLSDPRFPSGHVTVITAFVVATTLLYRDYLRQHALLFALIGGGLIAAVSFARMAVRAHCLVDVLAGIAVGAAVSAGVFLFLTQRASQK